MKTDGCDNLDFDWRALDRADGWDAWRNCKIRVTSDLLSRPLVDLDSLSAPGEGALKELADRCRAVNFAVYSVAAREDSVEADSTALVTLAHKLGFLTAESHRSAGHSGVVALRTSSEEGKKGFIPYTKRPLNWHTDGYYNPADNPVKGFMLHCHQQAQAGGENQLIDPEVAYLRMREANPAYVRAMMHPAAMTIPENMEADGSVRPASVGPVFFADERTGRLQMRYTARTRSIEWRDDPLTQEASAWLRDWLASDEPLMARLRLSPGQGIACNNVLHNRTAFEDGAGATGARIILRIRFHQRMAEEYHGAA